MRVSKCGLMTILLAALVVAAAAQNNDDKPPVLERRPGTPSQTAGQPSAQASQAVVTQGPTIQYADDQFAVITWSTNVATPTRLFWGTDANNLARAVGSGSTGTTHRVDLSNLQPATKYFFRVDTGEGQTPATGVRASSSFQTVATGAEPVHSQPATRLAVGAAIIKPPVIQYADENSAVITWSTNQPVASELYYGTSPSALNESAESPGSNTYHRVHISNLQPNSTYYFQLDTGEGTRGAAQFFRTVAAGAQPVYDQSAQAATVANPAGMTAGTASGAAQNTAPVPKGPQLIVPAGSVIEATLQDALSSKTAKVGDTFTAVVSQPVKSLNGQVAIPAGTTINGEVIEAEAGKTLPMMRGRGRLNLRFRDMTLPSHTSVPLSATLQSLHDKQANTEGEVSSSTSGKTAAKDVGIGAGAGTIAGLIFGSALKGLAIGAIAGGGYVLATGGKDVEVPANSGMKLRVDQQISVPAAAVSHAPASSGAK